MSQLEKLEIKLEELEKTIAKILSKDFFTPKTLELAVASAIMKSDLPGALKTLVFISIINTVLFVILLWKTIN